MRIGPKKSDSIVTQNRLWLVVALLVFIVGAVLGERGLLPAVNGYWAGFISQLSTGSGEHDLPVLIVDMPFENYNLLLEQRAAALATAVSITTESDFLNADIRLDNQTIPVRLRLRQGTAVHLGEDDKWNLDIRTRNDQQLLGMSRFYLLDPADNNWLNEWAFMQILQHEDILAPRYQFVRLIFNGDDRGVYALQEGFGAGQMTNPARPESVIVEYDATQLWESIAYMEGSAAAGADPIANLTASDFLYFEVDAFRDATIARDEQLLAQRDTAVALLRGLQSGELAASDVFDVKRYGRFLALVDLWGATQAISLTNLRYYYHPETGKLEPIGYNAAPALDDVTARIPLSATYNDPIIQAAYIAAAEQFSQSSYLTDWQAQLAADWQNQARALNDEISLAPPWEQLAQRQELLGRSLNPLQPVLAYLGPPELSVQAIIQVDVANVLNIPVEIVGFDIDGAAFLAADPAWLQGEPVLLAGEGIVLPGIADWDTAVPQFVRFHLPLTTINQLASDLDFNHEITIRVVTHIAGQEQVHYTPAVTH